MDSCAYSVLLDAGPFTAAFTTRLLVLLSCHCGSGSGSNNSLVPGRCAGRIAHGSVDFQRICCVGPDSCSSPRKDSSIPVTVAPSVGFPFLTERAVLRFDLFYV